MCRLTAWRRDRRERIEMSHAATRKSERLEVAIGHLRAEAIGIGSWANERFEANHLTDLFHRGRRQ